MADFGDLPKPEFEEYSLENWGQMLKVSVSLDPHIFPHKVSIPRKSAFFSAAYKRVYLGEGVTVEGSTNRIRPKGILVEHSAVLAVNNLGEVMVSNDVFEGNMLQSRTDRSDRYYQEYFRMLRRIKVPLGWRVIGGIHSHPVDDIGNEALFLINRNIPRVNGIPLTWSGGDFNNFISGAKYGYQSFITSTYINPNLLSFMVASKDTFHKLRTNEKIISELWRKHPAMSGPPYSRFKELGIVLYAGVHSGGDDKITLERLI